MKKNIVRRIKRALTLRVLAGLTVMPFVAAGCLASEDASMMASGPRSIETLGDVWRPVRDAAFDIVMDNGDTLRARNTSGFCKNEIATGDRLRFRAAISDSLPTLPQKVYIADVVLSSVCAIPVKKAVASSEMTQEVARDPMKVRRMSVTGEKYLNIEFSVWAQNPIAEPSLLFVVDDATLYKDGKMNVAGYYDAEGQNQQNEYQYTVSCDISEYLKDAPDDTLWVSLTYDNRDGGQSEISTRWTLSRYIPRW